LDTLGHRLLGRRPVAPALGEVGELAGDVRDPLPRCRGSAAGGRTERVLGLVLEPVQAQLLEERLLSALLLVRRIAHRPLLSSSVASSASASWVSVSSTSSSARWSSGSSPSSSASSSCGPARLDSARSWRLSLNRFT